MNKKPSLFSAITIGVGSIVGSGWLFASYYTAQYAGPIAILAWIIGAVFSLILALLLAEITTMYQETGLFSRLLSLTHNRDYGFIVAISNWLSIVASVASEAMASIQYIGYAFPKVSHIMFANGELTLIGVLTTYVIIVLYGVINYWGIHILSKTNNIITTVKMVVPITVGVIFMLAAFHPENFMSYKHTIAPYGISRAFSAVVNCGIFYAFFGFSYIAIFAKELDNPKRNIPLALVGSVVACLIIYLVLQVSFIGAIDPKTVATSGWNGMQFHSPLADLAIILGINWMALLLYIDAAVSPSGTAILYSGSGARMLYAMAKDEQMPKFFAKINEKFFISRTSLVFTLIVCGLFVIHFNNWRKMMIVVTVFQLISCLAVPIAFGALRKHQANKERLFKLPYGNVINLLAYVMVGYLLIECGFKATCLAFLLHVLFFGVYCITYYKLKLNGVYAAFRSSWTLFVYLLVVIIFAKINDLQLLHTSGILLFLVFMLIFYKLAINQKKYGE